MGQWNRCVEPSNTQNSSSIEHEGGQRSGHEFTFGYSVNVLLSNRLSGYPERSACNGLVAHQTTNSRTVCRGVHPVDLRRKLGAIPLIVGIEKTDEATS